MDSALTASDVALMNRDGWGDGNSFMWIFALLILAGGGGIFGNRGDYGQFATAASQQEILFGQQFQSLDNKMDRLGNGIADATFALNNSITGEGRGLQMQIANCCCENQRNVDSVRYDMAQNTQKILDAMAQDKIATLQNQINQLQLQNAVCGVVRYPMASTYTSGSNPFCSCGCGGIA